MSYDDNILIKLRRQYSRDEVVAHLLNTVKQCKIEKGKLSAYIEELKHENNLKKKQIKDLNRQLNNTRQLHKVRALKEQISAVNRENHLLKVENKKLREKLNLD